MTGKSTTKYTLRAKGISAESALTEIYNNLVETNTKLEEKQIDPLKTVSSFKYTIECIVNKSTAPGFDGVLNKQYESEKNFKDAELKAKKAYGKIPFKANTFSIEQTYVLNKKQEEILGNSKTKTTPAARDYMSSESLTSKLGSQYRF